MDRARLAGDERRSALDRLRGWVRGDAVPAAAPVPVRARVLMVCMGNICRSPTAEAVLRAKLLRAGVVDVEVASAGTHGHHHAGEAPDARAIQAARARGYDLSALRACPVGDDDLARFDHWIAMDAANLRWLQRRAAALGRDDRAVLLTAALHDDGAANDVPDPYYGAPAGFERVLDLIEAACDVWVQRLRPPPG